MARNFNELISKSHLRIARPTDRLSEVVAFYKQLGFDELGRFADHEGFDGVMLGHADAGYHLEFTHARGHQAGSVPTTENLLVFYIPDPADWQATIDDIERLGIEPVPSFNPYWDRNGKTYADPDGYRVVFQNASWDPD